MKQKIALVLAALLLSACAQSAPQSSQISRMTQEIDQSTAFEQTASPSGALPSSEPAAAAAQGDAAASTDDPLTAYYLIEAERDALELEEDLLRADFRVGKLTEPDFRAQSNVIREENQRLRQEQEILRPLVRAARTPMDWPTGNITSLLERAREIEFEEDSLELEEDKLEASYLSGLTDRETFISQQAELLRREDELEELEELYENALEALGWDD